ncbi:unnamed protein product [Cuscuta europaea]|uniref:Uncharacterized protein n=1 Tax=Cuscuta europaea TaxID=41803 RepID=A0A9P0ZHZ1_CUSEU|nr:unnamed protein product [Cuscuta europaea]
MRVCQTLIGHSDNFCPLNYEEGLVLEKRFEIHLRAGSEVKTSTTGGQKWLLEGSSSSGKSSGYIEAQKLEDKIDERGKDVTIESTQSFTKGGGRSQNKRFRREGRLGRSKQSRSKKRMSWPWMGQKTGRRRALLLKPAEAADGRWEATDPRNDSCFLAASEVY